MYQYRQFGSNDARTLPDWDAALRHIKVAHQACSNFVFIGWDVAFTPARANDSRRQCELGLPHIKRCAESLY